MMKNTKTKLKDTVSKGKLMSELIAIIFKNRPHGNLCFLKTWVKKLKNHGNYASSGSQ